MKERRKCPKCGHLLLGHRKPPPPFSRKYYECGVPGCYIKTTYGMPGPCRVSGADFKVR